MVTALRTSAIMVVVFVVASCGSQSDIAKRYELEKSIWKARQFKAAVGADPFSASREDFHAALAAFEGILADGRFAPRIGATRHSAIERDMDDLRLQCKIALAELYWVEYEEYAGVTYFISDLGARDLLFELEPDARLEVVRSLYRNLEDDSLENRCAGMLREVAEDDALWISAPHMGDTLLAAPGYVARVEFDRGKSGSHEHSRFAENFYSRVMLTWPGSPAAQKACTQLADLHVREGRFAEALNDVESALRSSDFTNGEEQLLLLKGQILAQGLKLEARAESVLTEVLRGYRQTPSAQGALLNLASLKMGRGEESEAVEMLRGLELQPETAQETAATAMFLRALCFERSDDWPEALNLLWRICRMEPFTYAAAASPLLVVRHYVEKGDSVGLDAALENARDYYVDAIDRENESMEHPHVVKDFLIEAYLLAGKPADAARLLDEQAERWRPGNGSVALFKSAMIYINLFDDRENGVRMLQKCLDAFPRSPYAWAIERELKRISTSIDGPRTG